MKRVLVEDLNTVRVVDAPALHATEDQAVIRLVAAGICGSDTHATAGHHPFLTAPYFPGHEAVGIVAEAAGSGAGPAAGTRVVLKPNLNCGSCENCQAERTNACADLRWIGCDPAGDYPGAMAEYFVAPASYLYPVPADVTDEQAALVECLATPVHAARIAGDLSGARVLIQGAGTIGILAVLAAQNGGAAQIVVTDLEPGKRERARRLGAHHAVDPLSATFAEDVLDAAGGRVDVIFDCVTNDKSAAQWLSVLRRAGTVCIVGVPPRDYALPMPLIQDWEIRVQGCAAYTEADIETAMALASKIAADEIVSATYPLEEAPAAFAEAAKGTAGKVLLVPGNLAN